jgi:hypothetical protein
MSHTDPQGTAVLVDRHLDQVLRPALVAGDIRTGDSILPPDLVEVSEASDARTRGIDRVARRALWLTGTCGDGKPVATPLLSPRHRSSWSRSTVKPRSLS